MIDGIPAPRPLYFYQKDINDGTIWDETWTKNYDG